METHERSPEMCTCRKARAYLRMAAAAHAAGNHDLGNHWSRRAHAVSV